MSGPKCVDRKSWQLEIVGEKVVHLMAYRKHQCHKGDQGLKKEEEI